jgi:hypothetical protein
MYISFYFVISKISHYFLLFYLQSCYYKTKFDPPKKTPKEKKLSDNIRKFLEKQEREDLEKQKREHEKKLEMLGECFSFFTYVSHKHT